MLNPLSRCCSSTVVAVGALAVSLLAHDDDPKLLHRQPSFTGTGYVAPGALAASPASAQSLGFPASGVALNAWLTFGDLGVPGAGGNDCWGYISPSGREYALMGTTVDTTFVEITNPSSPQVIAHIDGPDSTWRDIKVYNDHCYIVSEGGSHIQCVSLANIDSGVVTLVGTGFGGPSDTHNLALDTDSGYAYRCGGSGLGLRVYDLNADPTSPPQVGQWNDRYVHDAQVVTYTSGPLAGKQVAFCCGGFNGGWDDTGLTILDVTDKSNITVMDQVYYGPDAGYSHQGWLSEDRQYFYLSDEFDEPPLPSTVYVIDVGDPYNASTVTSFTNGNPSVTHNLYTKDGLIYAANYRSGMRVFDASDPLNPVEVAFFDTYPADDEAGFQGLWNAYPYFDSGTVIGSDRQRGLFVWTVTDESLTISLPAGAPAALDPAGDSVPVMIVEGSPGDLAPGSEKLFYDAGSGFIESPLVDTGGGSYDAVFPPLPCGTAVSWYIQAQTDSGLLFHEPPGAPAISHSSIAATGLSTVASYDMESTAGWTVGFPGDTATTGIWERVDPIGTAAQPEDDHTAPPGTDCWITGQQPAGGGTGANDVDDGATTLVSAVLDLSGTQDPEVGYWRWYSNIQGSSPNSDVFEVFISDDGVSWEVVEVVGPAGPGTSGGWIHHSFRVLSIPNVSLTSQVQLRFVASDLGSGSIVEAGVDDLRVDDIECGDGIGFTYCDPGVPNSTGSSGEIQANGSTLVVDNDVTLTATSLPMNEFGYFIGSLTQDFVFQPPGSQGNLCLGGAISRWVQLVQNTGAAGEMQIQVDLTAIPPPNAPVTAGETWHWQGWHRDNNPGATSNFTNGVGVPFQ